MKRALHLLAVIAVYGLPGAPLVRATLVPSLDVEALEKGAEVVAVGEVGSAREIERGTYRLRGQDVPARLVEVTLRVSRVLKGTAADEYPVRYYDTQALLGYDDVYEDRYGVFFLKREGEAYYFASPYHVSLVAARGPCESSGTPLARVAAEMACVLRTEGAMKRPRVEAISALATIKDEVATAALREAAREQPEPLDYLAADRLIARGDLSQLPLAERALSKSADISVEEEGYRLSTGWNSIEGISDRRAIPALARLTHAPDARTRQSALRALANTKDAAAIQSVLEGLADGAASVRWYAVMSLAELAGEGDEGGKWYPTLEAFEADEGLYLTHWKAWAMGKKGR